MFLIASCCTISYPFEIILKTAPCVEPGCIDKWHVASQHCMGKTRFMEGRPFGHIHHALRRIGPVERPQGGDRLYAVLGWWLIIRFPSQKFFWLFLASRAGMAAYKLRIERNGLPACPVSV